MSDDPWRQGSLPLALLLLLVCVAGCDREERPPANEPDSGAGQRPGQGVDRNGEKGDPSATPREKAPDSARTAAQLAESLERDFADLNRVLERVPTPERPVRVERVFRNQDIPARLARLLQLEMNRKGPDEELVYSRLIRKLYDDLDRLDPSGASKAWVDSEMMAQPYMRALYARVVGGLRRAVGETEILVEPGRLPEG